MRACVWVGKKPIDSTRTNINIKVFISIVFTWFGCQCPYYFHFSSLSSRFPATTNMCTKRRFTHIHFAFFNPIGQQIHSSGISLLRLNALSSFHFIFLPTSHESLPSFASFPFPPADQLSTKTARASQGSAPPPPNSAPHTPHSSARASPPC